MNPSNFPQFNWLDERAAGLLLHPTSLPGPHGIGTLGQSSLDLIGFLADAEIRYWQVLPLGPTGYGDSPYTSFSSFAGNPLLIDLQPLIAVGLLSLAEVAPLTRLSGERVDYGGLFQAKWPILRLAFRRFVEKKLAYIPNYGLYEDFLDQHSAWLSGYGLFMALKDRFGGKPWREWPAEWRQFHSAKLQKLDPDVERNRRAYCFFQYLFFGQWHQVRNYAARRGVEIIGDIPIYVALDSADTWMEPDVFELNADGCPTAVAGVPPDYFSETGQLWGNPLYAWERQKENDYAWWMRRLQTNFDLFDVVRLDHFRGFYDYWAIPSDAPDAREGVWKDGPREDFFRSLLAHFGGDTKIIAEDLGELGVDVHTFLARLGLPGMSILQFGFDGEDNSNLFLPHNGTPNSVVYAGTHDNDTVIGWYDAQPEKVRDQVRRYFRISGEDIAWDFVRAAYRSVSKLAIVQAQDLLCLDATARMNRPGQPQGNWQWRMTAAQFGQLQQAAPYLRELAWLYDR